MLAALVSKDTIQVSVNPAAGIVDCNGTIRPPINATDTNQHSSQTRTYVAAASAVITKYYFAGDKVWQLLHPSLSRVDILILLLIHGQRIELEPGTGGANNSGWVIRYFAGGYDSI